MAQSSRCFEVFEWFRSVGFVFDEFRLVDVQLVDSERFSPWRQQTGCGRTDWPESTGQTSDRRNSRSKHVCQIMNRSETLLSVWCRHGGIGLRLKSIEQASDCQIRRVTTFVGLRPNVTQLYYHEIIGTSKNVRKVNYFWLRPNLVRWISPWSTLVVTMEVVTPGCHSTV